MDLLKKIQELKKSKMDLLNDKNTNKKILDYEEVKTLLSKMSQDPEWTYIDYGYPVADGESMNDITNECVYYNKKENKAMYFVMNNYSKFASAEVVPEEKFQEYGINVMEINTAKKK